MHLHSMVEAVFLHQSPVGRAETEGSRINIIAAPCTRFPAHDIDDRSAVVPGGLDATLALESYSSGDDIDLQLLRPLALEAAGESLQSARCMRIVRACTKAASCQFSRVTALMQPH